jgi:hypothetical protein
VRSDFFQTNQKQAGVVFAFTSENAHTSPAFLLRKKLMGLLINNPGNQESIFVTTAMPQQADKKRFSPSTNIP